VSLAVLLDAVREGLEAPVFDAPDLTTVSFDNTLVLFYEGINLLSGNILPGKEYMFIKSHDSFAFLALVQPDIRRLSLNDCSCWANPGKKSVSETVESGDTGGWNPSVPTVLSRKPALRSATSQKTGFANKAAYTDF
jgi:hypothetical protein